MGERSHRRDRPPPRRRASAEQSRPARDGVRAPDRAARRWTEIDSTHVDAPGRSRRPSTLRAASPRRWRTPPARRARPVAEPSGLVPRASLRPRVDRTRSVVRMPDFEAVTTDPVLFAQATRIIHEETNPLNAQTLVQFHGDARRLVNPPALPLSSRRWTASTTCPTRAGRTPATARRRSPPSRWSRNSVTIMRGCFGGCTFCSITAHQGRIIQSRPKDRSWASCETMRDTDPDFTGVVTDIGGPTANMYQMRCTRPEVEAKCKRLSCVHPTICKLLGTDHGPLVELMEARRGARASARCSSPRASAWTWRRRRPSTCTSWPPTTSAATSRSPPSTPTRAPLEDEEAGHRQLRGVRERSTKRRRRRARSSTWSRTSSPPTPAATDRA